MHSANKILGSVGFSSMFIRPGDCSVAMGLGDLPIAAASHFINVMESAALGSITELLEPGESSRLIAIDLEVLDAVGIGAEIRATATCTEVDGREVVFNCEIHDGDRLIARAKMKRAVVERVTFLARTAAQSILGQSPH